MIPGLDSASVPTDAALSEAYASGVRLWAGYDGPGAAHDWMPGDFTRVKDAGMATIAYVFPVSDPIQMQAHAEEVGALLCLDNARGDTPDPFASSVGTWMESGPPKGMYGQPAVLQYWQPRVPMRFSVVTGVGGSQTNPLGFSIPGGNQVQATHTEFGVSVDRGIYDDWFAGDDMNDAQATAIATMIIENRFAAHGEPQPPFSPDLSSWVAQLQPRILAGDQSGCLSVMHDLETQWAVDHPTAPAEDVHDAVVTVLKTLIGGL